jgi:hypothetical protein
MKASKMAMVFGECAMVHACQDMATLAPKYSNPVANTKAVTVVGNHDFDAQI